MSADSVARWNAITMSRPDPGVSGLSTKRPREEDDTPMDAEDSDDDISIASRTPSPPRDQMDIDKYDEYVRGVEREVITVDTKIKSSNKGFAMLAKLGWAEGQPLGLSSDGRVDPVPFHVKRDLTGLGKTSQDVRMIETTVSQRRGLDSERQQKETEDQRRAREDSVARRAAVQSEISETLRAFYCDICDKQFKNVAQYDEHTNSYAHHHKVRFRDMQATQRQKQNTEEEVQRRNEKERKREEKHLRKIAAAAGVKMAKPVAISSGLAPASDDAQPSGFKKSSWATVAPTADPIPQPASGTRQSGWASVGAAPSPPPPPPDSSHSTGTWARAPAPPPPSTAPPRPPPSGPHESNAPLYHPQSQPPPAFRTGGWSSLDSTANVPTPPLSPPTAAPPPPPAGSGGWAPQPPPFAPAGRGFGAVPPPASRESMAAAQPPPVVPPMPIAGPQAAPLGKTSSSGRKEELREKSRSGWQSFQRGGRRK